MRTCMLCHKFSQSCDVDVNTKMNQSATSTAKCRPVKRHFLGKNIPVSCRSQRWQSFSYHVPAFRFGCWSEHRHCRHGNVIGGSFLKPRRNFAGISACDWRWLLNQSCACWAAVRTAWSASARPTHASSILWVSPRLHTHTGKHFICSLKGGLSRCEQAMSSIKASGTIKEEMAQFSIMELMKRYESVVDEYINKVEKSLEKAILNIEETTDARWISKYVAEKEAAQQTVAFSYRIVSTEKNAANPFDTTSDATNDAMMKLDGDEAADGGESATQHMYTYITRVDVVHALASMYLRR
mmetsp:Transcript_27908/g.65506  ORF Transcript_27908/g.65506 Transcript_27908/m.65506 type:complete len:297 (-) Transcript_27908:33-923(-)